MDPPSASDRRTRSRSCATAPSWSRPTWSTARSPAPSACSARPGWTTARRSPRWRPSPSSSARPLVIGSHMPGGRRATTTCSSASPARDRRRHQARLPRPRAAVPPRQQSGRARRGGEVQGDHPRVRDAARSGAPSSLRHVRRGRHPARGWARSGAGGDAFGFGDLFDAFFGGDPFGDRRGQAGPRGRPMPRP